MGLLLPSSLHQPCSCPQTLKSLRLRTGPAFRTVRPKSSAERLDAALQLELVFYVCGCHLLPLGQRSV